MADLAAVLERLGVSHYLDHFIAEGFDTWETVLDVTEDDFDALNVKRGHRRKIQREIATHRGVSADHALRSPSPSRKAQADENDRESDDAPGTPRVERKRSDVPPTEKRKYRRHPKPDENAPERPPSAYVLFSNRTRESLKGQNMSFTEIAKMVGQSWQVLPPEEKEAFESEAAAAKHEYNAKLLEYKKTDSYKEHVRYLADFRARHGGQHSGKRQKYDHEGRTSPKDNLGSQQLGEVWDIGTSHRERMEPIDGVTPETSSRNQVPAHATASSMALPPFSRNVSLSFRGSDQHDQQGLLSPTSTVRLPGVGETIKEAARRSHHNANPLGDPSPNGMSVQPHSYPRSGGSGLPPIRTGHSPTPGHSPTQRRKSPPWMLKQRTSHDHSSPSVRYDSSFLAKLLGGTEGSANAARSVSLPSPNNSMDGSNAGAISPARSVPAKSEPTPSSLNIPPPALPPLTLPLGPPTLTPLYGQRMASETCSPAFGTRLSQLSPWPSERRAIVHPFDTKATRDVGRPSSRRSCSPPRPRPPGQDDQAPPNQHDHAASLATYDSQRDHSPSSSLRVLLEAGETLAARDVERADVR